jgi:PTS system nitrogen regulatory IIA component
MKIHNVLTPNHLSHNLQVTSKKRILDEVARLLAQGEVPVTEAEVLQALTAREKLGATGLGHGVAIPHGRMNGISEPVGAFIKLKHPVEYDAHDAQPVDLVFGLMVPSEANESHLKLLAAIAEKFSDDAFCIAIRSSADGDEAFKLLVG